MGGAAKAEKGEGRTARKLLRRSSRAPLPDAAGATGRLEEEEGGDKLGASGRRKSRSVLQAPLSVRLPLAP